MTSSQQTTALVPFLSRVFWGVFGPLILLLCLFQIVSSGGGWFTQVNIIFLGVLVGLLVARWLDFRAGNPLTATGQPATTAHLRRYALKTLLIGVGVWVMANLMGNYWVPG
jgi:hypothetical protein